MGAARPNMLTGGIAALAGGPGGNQPQLRLRAGGARRNASSLGGNFFGPGDDAPSAPRQQASARGQSQIFLGGSVGGVGPPASPDTRQQGRRVAFKQTSNIPLGGTGAADSAAMPHPTGRKYTGHAATKTNVVFGDDSPDPSALHGTYQDVVAMAERQAPIRAAGASNIIVQPRNPSPPTQPQPQPQSPLPPRQRSPVAVAPPQQPQPVAQMVAPPTQLQPPPPQQPPLQTAIPVGSASTGSPGPATYGLPPSVAGGAPRGYWEMQDLLEAAQRRSEVAEGRAVRAEEELAATAAAAAQAAAQAAQTSNAPPPVAPADTAGALARLRGRLASLPGATLRFSCRLMALAANPGAGAAAGAISYADFSRALAGLAEASEADKVAAFLYALGGRPGAEAASATALASAVRGALPAYRRAWVERVWALLARGRPEMALDELVAMFDPRVHPAAAARQSMPSAILLDFTAHFSAAAELDSAAAGGPGERGRVPKAAFLAYYECESLAMGADADFEDLIKGTWHLTGR